MHPIQQDKLKDDLKAFAGKDAPFAVMKYFIRAGHIFHSSRGYILRVPRFDPRCSGKIATIFGVRVRDGNGVCEWAAMSSGDFP